MQLTPLQGIAVCPQCKKGTMVEVKAGPVSTVKSSILLLEHPVLVMCNFCQHTGYLELQGVQGILFQIKPVPEERTPGGVIIPPTGAKIGG